MLPQQWRLAAFVALAIVPAAGWAARAPGSNSVAGAGPRSIRDGGRLGLVDRGGRGFSLMELMIAIAIVGILATLAVPALFTPMVREQVASAAPLVDLAKKPIAKAWATAQAFPADNAAAGLPAADKMVNNYVASVAVNDGVIEVTFGNNAHNEIKGKVLTIRPAVVEDAPVVPVAWVCGYAGVPAKMTARGENATTITPGLLPHNCQPPPK